MRLGAVAARNLLLAAHCPYEEPPQRHDLGHMDVVCTNCKAFHWMAKHLVASLDSNPLFGMCCNQGQVCISLLHEPPSVLKSLFDSATPNALEFWANICCYNAALAFTSLGVEIDHQINFQGWGSLLRSLGPRLHRDRKGV